MLLNWIAIIQKIHKLGSEKKEDTQAQQVKNPPANAGDTGDAGSIPGLGTSPGGGHGYPLQYSCLEDLRDRGAWEGTVHRAAQS